MKYFKALIISAFAVFTACLLPAQITPGLTPISRGGTNATTAQQALINLGATSSFTPISRPLLMPAPATMAYTYSAPNNAYNVTATSLNHMLAKAGAAFSGTGRLDIVCLGTSITAGTGAPTKVGSWPSLLRTTLLQMGYPDGGSGLIVGQSNNSATTDSRVTLGTGWSAFQASNTPTVQGISTSGSITFADTNPATIVEVYYLDWFTFGASWTIDGAAQTDIAFGNTTLLKKVTVTGLSATTHTVVITPKTGADSSHPVYIVGVNFVNATGVAIHNLGVGGLSTANMTTSTAYGPAKIANFIAPQLTYIETGANDGVPLDTNLFTTKMTTIITGLQAVGSDVCLVGEIPTGVSTRPNAATVPLVYALADSYNLPVVDMSDRMISWTVLDALGLGYDTDGLKVHLSAAGIANMAQAMAGIFGRGPIIPAGGGSGTGANPTAAIGLTAVNGSAATFMRSDAAPSLSQGIAPLWTGTHQYSGTLPIQILSTATSGIQLNNQTDPTTNFEHLDLFWNGNIGIVRTINGGTGTIRKIRLASYSSSGAYVGLTIDNSANPQFLLARSASSSSTGTWFEVGDSTGTVNTSTSQVNFFAVTPTYNQTSTAASTDFLVNRTETAVGTGTQLLADLQVGGTSRFNIDNKGAVTQTTVARTSGTAAYHTIQIPSDTGLTASTESPGLKTITATRQWATGALTLQRENLFVGPTIAFVGASTLSDGFTMGITPVIQGTNATITRIHSLGILDSTSASSSITGGFVVATTFGTTATSVGIGGGNINAGGTISAGGTGQFARLGVGGAPTTNTGIGIFPSLTASSGTVYNVVSSATLTAAANGDSLGDYNAAGTLAKGSFTGMTAYNIRLGTDTTTGTGTIDNMYGLYIAAKTAGTTNYSIYTNAGLVRFGGAITSTSGHLDTSSTAGIGYGVGAGGTITQATSRTTGVTLNTINGDITLVSAAGSATAASFTVTDSSVGATDKVVIDQKSGTDLYVVSVTAISAGSFKVTFFTTGGTTTEQPVFTFAVIKGSNS